MIEPAPESSAGRPNLAPVIAGLVWTIVFVALAGWAIVRLDIFPLSAAVPLDGAGRLPRALYTVDHPFHTARVELLRSAWASFDTVRWVASHQGGYPAEFYPLGAQAIAAALAFVAFGHLATASAWALTIALIFLLPGVAYLLIGRVDRLTPAVAAVALAGQIAIASDWTHGGFTELVEWGLATNVAGFTWALLALPLLAGGIDRRSPALLGIAVGSVAMCAVTNPRALLAVAVVGVAMLLDAALRRDLRTPAIALAVAATLAAGLAAPVLVPLVRYRDLYFFLSYQDYADLAAYRSATVDAVSWPILLLAGLGAALALSRREHRAARVATQSLGLYMLLTALMVVSPGLRHLIPQLELPRLMPFQRLLVIWLAAYGAVEGIRLVARVPDRLRLARDASVAIAAAVALLVVFASDAGPFPPAEQGLRAVPRTEGPAAVDLAQFRDAVALADDRAPGGTGILVIGSRLDWSGMNWHEQLWAPMVAPDRRFYYNDWLWYWHRLHAGPYDYRQGHFYPDPSRALDRAYLDEHGIGAVVITDTADRSTGVDARRVAAESPALQRTDTIGVWDVYVVRDPVGLATLDGKAPHSTSVSGDGETIRVTFDNAEAGTVKVRQNWFPRWQATVNGEEVPVARGEDGYMEIEAPGGDVTVVLRYGVTIADTAARFASAVSAVITVALVVAARPIRRWARR
jgi:hypothetical protein